MIARAAWASVLTHNREKNLKNENNDIFQGNKTSLWEDD
jgi:hypothetical protein